MNMSGMFDSQVSDGPPDLSNSRNTLLDKSSELDFFEFTEDQAKGAHEYRGSSQVAPGM
jgi:hypothetical protein